jgi:glyoxylase-like metal-dependent hydrolase (beta-lactamase superfamily II)
MLFDITNNIFNSRTYVLGDSNFSSVWLVDCGDIDKVLAQIRDRAIAGVLLTHAHFDHIYGLPELLRHFPHCQVVTNEAGLEALADSRRNLSRYHETPIAVSPENVLLVQEGDSVPLFDDLSARVYQTPGHHPSCLSFEIGDCLYTGDAYIPGEKVITNLPGGDKAMAAESVKRILELGVGKTIWCGHAWIWQSSFPC